MLLFIMILSFCFICCCFFFFGGGGGGRGSVLLRAVRIENSGSRNISKKVGAQASRQAVHMPRWNHRPKKLRVRCTGPGI